MIRDRLLKTYVVLCPDCSPRTLTGWFHSELAKRGVRRHPVSVGRWLSGKHPMPQDAWLVLTSLERRAREELRRREEEIG